MSPLGDISWFTHAGSDGLRAEFARDELKEANQAVDLRLIWTC